MSAAQRSKLPMDSAVVGELIAEHFAAVRRFWQIDSDSYQRLADLIISDPTQRAMVAQADAQLPRWLAEAIRTHAHSAAAT
ncbi:MAG: TipAS antibiotic-recognition domain-containing protein [Antricoccus sp.]